jgi:hypothetical protein
MQAKTNDAPNQAEALRCIPEAILPATWILAVSGMGLG